MTAGRYVFWIIMVAVWLVVLSVVQIPLRKKRSLPLRIIILAVKVISGILLAFVLVALYIEPIFRFEIPLAALYVALFGESAGDLLHLIFVRSKNKNRNRLHFLLGVICTAAYMIYGTVNMQTVTADHFTVTSAKLDKPYKFVFVSDLHVGSAQSMRTTENTIRRINEENADFVVLGGDIVDIRTTGEEMEKTFSFIGEIEAPVFYIYGNHDRQRDYDHVAKKTFTEEELESAILSNGIRILRDEWISFSEDLVIFGREDAFAPERKKIDEIEKRPEDKFVLLADHSPYEKSDIIASKADLQVSGHTHAGQLFPLQWVYRLLGYEAYGWFRHGDTDLFVSSGAAGWNYPFRTEAGCHYDVISILPENM